MTEFIDDDDDYIDNPYKVLQVNIKYDLSNEELFYNSMKNVVKEIIPMWSNINNNDINVSNLAGGITNIIYLLNKKNDNNNNNNINNPNTVIVRIYGDGTDMVIDRNVENIVFSSLSSLRIGPIYYGRFLNGRIEGYISARSVHMEEMNDLDIYPRTAYSIAQLHSQQIDNIDKSLSIFEQLYKYIDIAKSLKFENSNKQEAYNKLNLTIIENELKRLNDYIHEIIEDGLDSEKNSENGKKHHASWHRAGVKLVTDISLCHNDLLSGNILVSHDLLSIINNCAPSARDDNFNNTDGITLIDYEYAAYNYRGYDLANHFCEFGGFDFNIKEHFPKFETRAQFIYHYACAVANRKDTSLLRLDSGTRAAISYIATLSVANIFNNEETLTFLLAADSMIRPFCLLAHLYWGTWSILQAMYSPVDFDYME